jgi:hypothetical protein
LTAIEEAFKANPSEEKELILKELSQTMKIFSMWMNPETRQESVEIREKLMKDNFDSYLKSTPDAKAIFKMGGAHTIYGISSNGIFSLGNHVQKVAKKRGSCTLSISLRRFDPKTSLISLDDFKNDNMVLLDAKAYLQNSTENSMTKDLTGFDAIIYIKDAGFVRKSVNQSNEKAFQNDFIKSLFPLAFGLLTGLAAVITMSISFFFKSEKGVRRSYQYIGFGFLPGILLVVVQLVWMVDYPAQKASISASLMPQVLFSFFLLLSAFSLYWSWKILKNKIGSFSYRLYFALLTTGFCLLSYAIYFWNIGGMLS